jgi:hypothetical protein
MYDVKVWDLDVWGDAEEYVVNDRCEIGKIKLPRDFNDEMVIQALIDANFLKSDVSLNDVEIYADTEYFCSVDLINGVPLYELEIMEEECYGVY